MFATTLVVDRNLSAVSNTWVLAEKIVGGKRTLRFADTGHIHGYARRSSSANWWRRNPSTLAGRRCASGRCRARTSWRRVRKRSVPSRDSSTRRTTITPIHGGGRTTPAADPWESTRHGTCTPTRCGLTSVSRPLKASRGVSFERFTPGRLSYFPGPVKLWESPGRAGGLPK